MRISGGHLAGKTLNRVFPASVKPTTELAREAIMTLLGQEYSFTSCHALDLFSGSGIVSLELLSRGCRVHSVDADTQNINFYRKLSRLWELKGWSFEKAEALNFLQNTSAGQYDIIFADPPYGMPGLQALPAAVLPLLRDGGIFIMEHRPELLFQAPLPFRQKLYGRSMFSMFKAQN